MPASRTIASGKASRTVSVVTSYSSRYFLAGLRPQATKPRRCGLPGDVALYVFDVPLVNLSQGHRRLIVDAFDDDDSGGVRLTALEVVAGDRDDQGQLLKRLGMVKDRPIHLDLRQWQFGHAGEGCVACAEVVYREGDADLSCDRHQPLVEVGVWLIRPVFGRSRFNRILLRDLQGD